MALKGNRAVFVGNIPYDTTEETMIEIFQEVGPVVNFRINKDRETGKAKGFGFCEYHDAATAASAVRNLDGYAFSGRQLKVAPADSEGPSQAPPVPPAPTRFAPPQPTFPTPPRPHFNGGSVPQPPSRPFQPPSQVPPPSKPNPSSTSTTPVTPTGDPTMSSEQIFELLTQINIMVQYSPETARSFLSQNPQLCYALFQTLYLLNLMDPALHKGISDHVTAGPTRPSRPDGRPPAPPPHHPYSRPPPSAPSHFPPRPPSLGKSHPLPPSSSGSYPPPPNFTSPTITSHHHHHHPPPHHFPHHRPPPSSTAPPSSNFHPHSPPIPPFPPGPDQQHLLRQVLHMTPDQIHSFPPEHRDSLLRLRHSLMLNRHPPSNHHTGTPPPPPPAGGHRY